MTGSKFATYVVQSVPPNADFLFLDYMLFLLRLCCVVSFARPLLCPSCVPSSSALVEVFCCGPCVASLLFSSLCFPSFLFSSPFSSSLLLSFVVFSPYLFSSFLSSFLHISSLSYLIFSLPLFLSFSSFFFSSLHISSLLFSSLVEVGCVSNRPCARYLSCCWCSLLLSAYRPRVLQSVTLMEDTRKEAVNTNSKKGSARKRHKGD